MDPTPDAGGDAFDEASSIASEEIPDVDGVVEEDEGEGEDLFGDGAQQDYRSIPTLDTYEHEGLDEDFVEDVTFQEKQQQVRAAERALNRRDRQGRRKGKPDALFDDDDASEDGTEDFTRPARRRRVKDAQDADMPEQEGEEELLVSLEDIRGKARDWIGQERISKEIAARFRKFLRNFKDENTGEFVYRNRLWKMIQESKRSLDVDYIHMGLYLPSKQIAVDLIDYPTQMLPILDKVATELAIERLEGFKENWGGDVSVRVVNIIHEEKIRDLKADFLDTLVTVQGVVTRRTGIFPQLKLVHYDCGRCGTLLGPFTQNGDREVRPMRCANCQGGGPFTINQTKTVYTNYQRLTLQESPGTVPPGRLPRAKSVVVTQDLIDCARPGDEVVVSGIYTHAFDSGLNKKSGFPVFTTQIEANSIKRNEDVYASERLTDEDMDEIKKLSKDPRIAERLASSIGPSIHGHEYIKMAIALALFGGVEKMEGVHRMRGDINVLLLGDPGVGKSQFLKYTEKTAQRCVYTTGKGASAVGLTAAVQKDPVTKEWTLEGGALVLADRGVCLIDEFDKMDDQDRVSIHEAMEQQSISISKAGIITELHARCTVIAAANPIGGRYDVRRSFRDNVYLEDPILSRFDCLCVIRDVVDVIQDGILADFVVGSHMKSHPYQNNNEEEAFHRQQQAQGENGDDAEMTQTQTFSQQETQSVFDPDIIPQHLLRKYLVYAKMNFQPRWSQEGDLPMMTEVYNSLRREAGNSHGINITVRHLESMIRMAEAHAKMHLRPVVETQDIHVAVRMMVESFITAQKLGVQRDLRSRLRKYLVRGQSSHTLMMTALREMVRQRVMDIKVSRPDDAPEYITIPTQDVQQKARRMNVNWESFLKSRELEKSRFIVEDAVLKIHWLATSRA
ncbi:hypothetical protein BSKO_02196 [Bryopsis sp. KO-2023]|nr:hypothetical protein BSKO_02196 [Bryopsis sp. KO-2023]